MSEPPTKLHFVPNKIARSILSHVGAVMVKMVINNCRKSIAYYATNIQNSHDDCSHHHRHRSATLLSSDCYITHPYPRPKYGPLSDPNLFDHHHQTPPNTDNVDLDYDYDLSSFQYSNSNSGVSDATAAADGKQTDSLLDDSDVSLPTTIVDGKDTTTANKDATSFTKPAQRSLLRGESTTANERRLPSEASKGNIPAVPKDKASNLFNSDNDNFCSHTKGSELVPTTDCLGFVYCSNGEMSGSITLCSPGLIFDANIGICNWPSTENVCGFEFSPNKHTGFVPFEDCSKFYYCSYGKIDGDIDVCPEGTLFDHVSGICNWKSAVTCDWKWETSTPGGDGSAAANNPVYEGNEMVGDNPFFTEDSGSLRGRRLPHMITFDKVQYDAHENENIFIDETMVKEGDQPTGENVLGPNPPLPSPTVVGDEVSIPTQTSVVDRLGVHLPPSLIIDVKEEVPVPPTPAVVIPPIIDDESIVVPKDELSGSVEDSLGLPDGTVKSILVEEDKPIIDSTKIWHDTTPPSAPLEDTEPEAIAELTFGEPDKEEEDETYKLKDVIITSVLCEKANDIQTTAQAIEFDEELPYFVKVIACGIGWGWYWNWDETPPTTLKDQEPITWLVSEKSLGTNYGGGNKIIWEAEADDFIWEDEAEDFRLGSIIRSKADGILKVKHPGEPDIDILIDSDGSLFEDKWPDAGDYDLVAKRIWGEESGDFIVKLIWGEESGDFIIQVGKTSYSVKYDDIKKKGVIVKK